MNNKGYIHILAILVIIPLLIILINEESEKIEKYVYECVDFNGNVHYADKITTAYGNSYIILEDESRVYISRYKRILESEVISGDK